MLQQMTYLSETMTISEVVPQVENASWLSPPSSVALLLLVVLPLLLLLLSLLTLVLRSLLALSATPYRFVVLLLASPLSAPSPGAPLRRLDARAAMSSRSSLLDAVNTDLGRKTQDL